MVPLTHHLINREFPSTEASPTLQQGNFAAVAGAHQGSSGGQYLQNVFDRTPFQDAPATTSQPPPENRFGPGGGTPFGSYGGAGLVPFNVIDKHPGMFHQNMYHRPASSGHFGPVPVNSGAFGSVPASSFGPVPSNAGSFGPAPANSGGPAPANAGAFAHVPVDPNTQRPMTPATPAQQEDHPSMLQGTPGRRHSMEVVVTASEPDEDRVKDGDSRPEDNTGDTTDMEDVVPPKMYMD